MLFRRHNGHYSPHRQTCKQHANEACQDRVFHTKQLAYLKGGKNYFNIQIVPLALNKVTNPFLSDNGKMAFARKLKVKHR